MSLPQSLASHLTPLVDIIHGSSSLPEFPGHNFIEMDPRNSIDNLAQPQSMSLVATNMRPDRGRRGYRTFSNGILDATPITDEEIAICNANASKSPLLRLPAELRLLIWEFALGGYILDPTLRVRPSGCSNSALQDLFTLLRTCRQVHGEGALMPYSMNTFRFKSTLRFEGYRTINPLLRDAGFMKHLQNVKLTFDGPRILLHRRPRDHSNSFHNIEVVWLNYQPQGSMWYPWSWIPRFYDELKALYGDEGVTVSVHR